MDEDEMYTDEIAELLKETAEENQTRKILAIMSECDSLEEAVTAVKALID